MALETVVNIADLVKTNPNGAEPKSQGDDHIRNLKNALLNDFAGFLGAVMVTGTDGGAANAYILTPANALPAYGTKMIAVFAPTVENTGACTLNISGLGVKGLLSVSGAALVAGDLVVGTIYSAFYDGAQFRLTSITKNYADQLAFSTALPTQSLGFLRSSGAVTGFTTTHTGYAQNEVKGADIASAATINLTTTTGNLVHVTGTTTITAITIPGGAERTVIFDGALTLTHGAALLLPGAVSITTAANDRMIVRGDTAGAVVVSYNKANGFAVVGAGDQEVVVHTGNGSDSTNAKIRRFTTTLTSTGTAITYADSAAAGATFTINETGLYSVAYADGATTSYFGVSCNLSNLTVTPDNIPPANRIVVALAVNVNPNSTISRTVRLLAGDVVRAHSDSTNNTSNGVTFAIRKVGT